MGSLNLNIKRETSRETLKTQQCPTSSLHTLTFVHEQSLAVSYLPMQVLSMKIRDFPLPGTTWHPGLPSNLTLHGEVVAQSMACARFLAREFNLAGRNSMEMAQVDEIVDVIQDLLNTWYSLYHAKDSEGQKKFLEANIPTSMSQIEKKLVSRGGQFMVGNAFSWADLHLFFYVTDMKLMSGKDVDASFPKIKNLVERVGDIPNIKTWVKNRPPAAL